MTPHAAYLPPLMRWRVQLIAVLLDVALWWLPGCCGLFIYIAIKSDLFVGEFRDWTWRGLCLTEFILFLGAIAVRFVGNPASALRRRLPSADDRLCDSCGYDLTGLPDIGTCPECRREYEMRVLRANWRQWREVETRFAVSSSLTGALGVLLAVALTAMTILSLAVDALLPVTYSVLWAIMLTWRVRVGSKRRTLKATRFSA